MLIKIANVSEEYKKNKLLRTEDVKALQEWTEKQPHLPEITELQLILFLQSCYFSLTAAKKTIDNYYTIRNHWPECFSNRDVHSKDAQDFLNVSIISPLPKPTPENYRVLYSKLMDVDANNYVFSEQCKNFDMNMMLWLMQEGTQEGLVLIIDMQGASLAHLTRLGIVALKKCFFYIQEAIPIRLKAVHFIHVVPFIDKLMFLVKPFMKNDLLNMLHFHTDSLESLYKFIPKDCLPRDIGGMADSIYNFHESSKKNIVENADYFIEDEKKVVNESKRLGKPKTESEVFGIEGSFRKLDLD